MSLKTNVRDRLLVIFLWNYKKVSKDTRGTFNLNKSCFYFNYVFCHLRTLRLLAYIYLFMCNGELHFSLKDRLFTVGCIFLYLFFMCVDWSLSQSLLSHSSFVILTNFLLLVISLFTTHFSLHLK